MSGTAGADGAGSCEQKRTVWPVDDVDGSTEECVVAGRLVDVDVEAGRVRVEAVGWDDEVSVSLPGSPLVAYLAAERPLYVDLHDIEPCEFGYRLLFTGGRETTAVATDERLDQRSVRPDPTGEGVVVDGPVDVVDEAGEAR